MPPRALKAQDPKTAKPSKPKILVFGPPGVGKTWTAIDFPRAYYIDTEGGANFDQYKAKLAASGGMYMGPDLGSQDFHTVIEEVITLATQKHDFRTLVIDSFTKLFNTAYSATTERMERANEKIAFGNDKRECVGLSRRLVRWLDKLDMNVILVCHEKDLWENGTAVGKTFDGWDKLAYELHLSLQIMKQGAARKARVIKTRVEAFPDATVLEWSAAEFVRRYGKDVIDSSATPISLATEQQVKQLGELIELLKVPAEQTDKWREKAGVDGWAEMDTETIGKCISALTERLPKVA